MSVINSVKPQWSLVKLDEEGRDIARVQGQFAPESGIDINISGNIAEIKTLNTSAPFVQWLNGNSDVITFDSLLFAQTSRDSIVKKFLDFVDLVKRDFTLKRPPVCVFIYGTTLESNQSLVSKTVLVESIGGVNIARLTDQSFRTDLADEILDTRTSHKVRQISMSFTLRQFVDITIKTTDITKPPKLTRNIVTSGGDTYESIAKREYGDPLFGVVLRQFNNVAILSDGDIVRIPNEDIVLNEPISPEFHAFGDDEASILEMEDVEESRAKSINTFIFP